MALAGLTLEVHHGFVRGSAVALGSLVDRRDYGPPSAGRSVKELISDCGALLEASQKDKKQQSGLYAVLDKQSGGCYIKDPKPDLWGNCGWPDEDHVYISQHLEQATASVDFLQKKQCPLPTHLKTSAARGLPHSNLSFSAFEATNIVECAAACYKPDSQGVRRAGALFAEKSADLCDENKDACNRLGLGYNATDANGHAVLETDGKNKIAYHNCLCIGYSDSLPEGQDPGYLQHCHDPRTAFHSGAVKLAVTTSNKASFPNADGPYAFLSESCDNEEPVAPFDLWATNDLCAGTVKPEEGQAPLTYYQESTGHLYQAQWCGDCWGSVNCNNGAVQVGAQSLSYKGFDNPLGGRPGGGSASLGFSCEKKSLCSNLPDSIIEVRKREHACLDSITPLSVQKASA